MQKSSPFSTTRVAKLSFFDLVLFLHEKIADAFLSDPSAFFLTSALYYNDTPTSAFFMWSSNVSLNASAWPNVNITRPVVDKCLAIGTGGIFQASCEKPAQFICERPRRCELIFLFNYNIPYLKDK